MGDTPTVRRVLTRLLVACFAGLGAAIVAAVVFALVDAYVTGHGRGTIRGRLLDWPAAGVHLSPADVILLAVAAMAAVIAWRRTRPPGA